MANYQRFQFENCSPERQDELIRKQQAMQRQRRLLEEQIREKEVFKRKQETEAQQKKYTHIAKYNSPSNLNHTGPLPSNVTFLLPPINVNLGKRSTFVARKIVQPRKNLHYNSSTIHNSFFSLRSVVSKSAPVSRLESPRKNDSF